MNVYDVIVPCELGVVFGGCFENPSAFINSLSLVFFKGDVEKVPGDATNIEAWKESEAVRSKIHLSILKTCFDEVVDITGLDPKDAAEKIRSTVEAYQ